MQTKKPKQWSQKASANTRNNPNDKAQSHSSQNLSKPVIEPWLEWLNEHFSDAPRNWVRNIHGNEWWVLPFQLRKSVLAVWIRSSTVIFINLTIPFRGWIPVLRICDVD